MELTGAMFNGVSSLNGVLRAEHAAADMIPDNAAACCVAVAGAGRLE